MPSDARRPQKQWHPRDIAHWVDPVSGLIVVRHPDGYTFARDRDYWASIAVQAIREPEKTSELTVAMVRAVLGDDGWKEAERIVAIVDESAKISGVEDAMRQAMH